MNRDYNLMSDVPPIRTYAFLGTPDVFMSKLRFLASLAEEESWYYDNPNFNDGSMNHVAVLYQYIFHTFSKVLDEGLLLETASHSIFNTGLISRSGQDIYMLFSLNRIERKGSPKWFFNSFYESSAHEIPVDMRSCLPMSVDYFKGCRELMYFDERLPILGNINHIVKDRLSRMPDSVKLIADLDESLLVALVQSSTELMIKKIKKNNRLVLVQYWNKRLMYLAPLYIGDEVMALAIERHENSYRINTILTLDMAYCNARLISRPESSWLVSRFPGK